MSIETLLIAAARKQYRFPSNRNELSFEQLWQLPLVSANGFDLNTVAVEINRSLKALTEESFVNTKPTPGKADTENKLELVKFVIATKQEEQDKARRRADKAAEREKFVQLLAKQEDAELEKLSADEIRAKLAAMDDEE